MSTIVETSTTIDVPSVSDKEGYRREILLRAAEIAEREGYECGPRGMEESGGVCLLGAVLRALDGDWDVRYLTTAALIGVLPEDAYTWSDSLNPQLSSRKEGGAPEKIIASALRRLANGASWGEATKP